MRKLFLLIITVAVPAAAWKYRDQYKIPALDKIALLAPRATGPVSPATELEPAAPPVERRSGTIRVASFNIQVFGASKLSNPRVMSVLAEVVRRFDVVAIQEVRSKSQDILPRFIDQINSTGRHYDFVIGPRLGRTVSTEQYAFVFDSASIEIDRSALYTVADPDDLLHREPLVGWFRVRGPPPDQAFTFSLIDMHTDPDETKQELNQLDDVFRSVRDDGRGEDDVILLGDLNVDDHHLGELGQVPDIRWVLSGVATNTIGKKLYDNILFAQNATTEFTGRAGVFDLIREFNLTMDEALKISDHMPIWAEFSVYEGGQAGRVAARQDRFNRH